MSNKPKIPGHEPDPDSLNPQNDVPDMADHDAENIEEVGEPFDGNFA